MLRSRSSPRCPSGCADFSTCRELDPANLREAAADPGFLLGILDYVSGDEALLVAFATDAGIDANAIETARRLLSNGS